MLEHPWCRDVSRDTAVRAAEDAAASELPALPEWRDLPERVARLECSIHADTTEFRKAIAKCKERLADLARKLEMPAWRNDESSRTEETPQSGMRTERVTLEMKVVTECPPVTEWPWDKLPLNYSLRLLPGESVRVVPSAEADAEVERLASESDAAIRERESALARVKELEASVLHCEQCNQAWSAEAVRLREDIAHAVRYRREAEAERDAALARVAELEEQAERVDAAVGATAEKFVNGHSALKARVAELEKQWADAEPVAWGFTYANGSTDGRFYNSRSAAEEAVPDSGTVVPLYRAPPPPRGWLTERDRQTMIAAAVFCSGRGEKGISEALEWILARNSPPTVRLPEPPFARSNVAYGDWMMCLEAVKKALAAAGVEVDE